VERPTAEARAPEIHRPFPASTRSPVSPPGPERRSPPPPRPRSRALLAQRDDRPTDRTADRRRGARRGRRRGRPRRVAWRRAPERGLRQERRAAGRDGGDGEIP